MNSHSTLATAETSIRDQDLIDEVYRRRAAQLADRRSTHTRAATVRALVFRLGAERYAIELSELAEVLPYNGCTAIPGAPAGLIGVLNVRGDITAVADLHWILGLEPGGANGPGPSHAEAAGYVLTLRQQGRSVGFKVDTIDHVREIDIDAAVAAHSATPSIAGARCVKALTPDSMIVVDTQAALAHLSPLFA